MPRIKIDNKTNFGKKWFINELAKRTGFYKKDIKVVIDAIPVVLLEWLGMPMQDGDETRTLMPWSGCMVTCDHVEGHESKPTNFGFEFPKEYIDGYNRPKITFATSFVRFVIARSRGEDVNVRMADSYGVDGEDEEENVE